MKKNVTQKGNATMKGNVTPRSHIYVLLDRSGSMESMRTDVVGGFNRLVADQKADGPDARFTLVQFDTEDPQEVITDAVPVTTMVPLTQSTFVPRGGTPLLDATGRIIARAAVRAEERRALGKKPEDITIVTITDGEENSSREYTRRHIRKMVEARQAEGWSFVFLGAGIDAYAEAGGLGYDARSVQAFAPTPAGAGLAFESVSRAMASKRAKIRGGQRFDAADFFEGEKEAEQGR